MKIRSACCLGVIALFSIVSSARAQELTVASAADLRPALEEIASGFQGCVGRDRSSPSTDRREISISRFRTARRLISFFRRTRTIRKNWKPQGSPFPELITNMLAAKLC